MDEQLIDDRLLKQIDFLASTDRLKGVLRTLRPIGMERRENSAEHSWQLMLAAVILAEHATDKIDLLRVLKMLAIHDVPEIISGDVMHYFKPMDPGADAEETRGAEEIFASLPEDQRLEYLALWKEFEERVTPDARFAAALDRLVGFIILPRNGGDLWVENNIAVAQCKQRNAHIERGSKALWSYVLTVIEDARKQGLLRE